jgi:hypothetical protein
VFDDAASTTNVEKVLRIPVGGTVGFVPTTSSGGAFSDLRLQHSGSTLQWHDSLEASVIPDSAVFDDWADNKLTSRDNFDTTPYAFSPLASDTNDDRPEWVHQGVDTGGQLTATNQRLVYEWGGGSPVTYLSTESSFDGSGGMTWYLVGRAASIDGTAGSSATALFSQIEDGSSRSGGDELVLEMDFGAGSITFQKVVTGGATTLIGPVSQSMSEGTFYGFLLERDGSGNFELFFDPADPANPQASESIGTATDTYLPDMSGASAGFQFTTSHDENQMEFDRAEVV